LGRTNNNGVSRKRFRDGWRRWNARGRRKEYGPFGRPRVSSDTLNRSFSSTADFESKGDSGPISTARRKAFSRGRIKYSDRGGIGKPVDKSWGHANGFFVDFAPLAPESSSAVQDFLQKLRLTACSKSIQKTGWKNSSSRETLKNRQREPQSSNEPKRRPPTALPCWSEAAGQPIYRQPTRRRV